MRKLTDENRLAIKRPDLAKEWHPTLNGELHPTNVSCGMTKKVWWQCPKHSAHEYTALISNRTRENGTGCPYCADNNLAVVYPHIAKEWHPTKNGELQPTDVTFGSGKKVWWQCCKNPEHVWSASVNSRTNSTNNTGCPYCTGVKLSKENTLAVKRPDISEEWHPTKNGRLNPTNVSASSDKKVYWQCSYNPKHEWMSTVFYRNKGGKCPYCKHRFKQMQ